MVNTYLLSIPTETWSIRKTDVFWCFQGVVQKGNNDLEWVKIFLKSYWHRPSNSISKYVTPNHEAKISWITIVLLNSKIPMELLLPLLFLPHREIIVCIGAPHLPPKKIHPLFFTKLPLNLQTVQASLFRQFPPIYCFCGFSPKIWIFQ